MSVPAATASNPVYDRLTRGDRGPSAHISALIGAGVGAAVGLLTYAIAYAPSASLGPILVALAIEPLVAILTPPVGLIAAAVLAGRYAGDEDFALLRLTGLSARKIAEGYAGAILHRLRVLWAVATWSPAAWMITLFVMFGMRTLWLNSVIILVLFIAGLVTLMTYFVSRSFVKIGVWIGLRRARHAAVVAAVGSIGALMVCCLGLIVLVSSPFSTGVLAFLTIGLILLPVVINAAESLLSGSAELFVAGQIGAQNPPDAG